MLCTTFATSKFIAYYGIDFIAVVAASELILHMKSDSAANCRKLRVAPEGSNLSSVWLKKSETVDYVRRRSI